MPSKQGVGRNKIDVKKLTLYALLVAVCMVLGFVESLLNLSFIAPGIKIGLANSVVITVAFRGDTKGAFLINITRIILSALLFSSPFTLLYSLSAGLVSVSAAALLSKCKKLGIIGVSSLCGFLHNAVQLFVAKLILGVGVLYYLPLLALSGIFAGMLVGTISGIIIKKLETNGKK